MGQPGFGIQSMHQQIFRMVHRGNLIYNTCWEDPELDQVAFDLKPDDHVLVITSAGCNALDYLLKGVAGVHAVDMNPIQNSLLELKKACIETLDYDDFWKFFGEGKHPKAKEIYKNKLRPILPEYAQAWWDRKIGYFAGRGWRSSFYYRGTSGLFAKLVMTKMHLFGRMRQPISDFLGAKSIEEQADVWMSRLHKKVLTPSMRWFLGRRFTMTLVGVPGPQIQQIRDQYEGGLVKFIEDAILVVATKLPMHTNYFWRVYIEGRYHKDACPNYLREENFHKLKGLVNRLEIRTSTVEDFLKSTPHKISKFTLLDHMDWMARKNPQGLVDEWNALLKAARPGATILYRSAGLHVDYLDDLKVESGKGPARLGDLLEQDRALAERLHPIDRVHTYGSFYIARLKPGATVSQA